MKVVETMRHLTWIPSETRVHILGFLHGCGLLAVDPLCKCPFLCIFVPLGKQILLVFYKPDIP